MRCSCRTTATPEMLLLLLVVYCGVTVAPSPRVTLPGGGDIEGIIMTSQSGHPFAAFRGIPYAEPPVGQLRFKAPVPRQPWSGLLNATADAPLCTQKNYFLDTPVVIGQEDCLYLNVYMPMPDMKWRRKLLPTMVYIHGGGWFSGSGASYFEGPHYLMNKEVILVTFNYRLGPLGFLSTDDAEAPGNYALKDQVCVLQWIRKNIAAFGGDSSSVTIFGQSAGAGSVHLLLLSPVAKGLFHKAIAQSGVALNPWSFPEIKPLSLARRHAVLLGCNQSNTSLMVQCLRNVDHREVVDATDKLKFWSIDPLTLYRPVIDPSNISEEEKFLPEHPLIILSNAIVNATKGQTSSYFTDVPFMLGVVQNEGIMRAIPILTDSNLVDSLNGHIDELLPKLMELERSTMEKPNMNKQQVVTEVYHYIKSHFFHHFPLNQNNSESLINLYTERGFLHGVLQTAVYHRMAGQKNMFVYSFEYRGSRSYTPVFAKTTQNFGVCHCDDLLYLFSTPAIFPDLPESSADWKVVDGITSLWTNFASLGKPTLVSNSSTSSQLLTQERSCWQNYTEVLWPNAGIFNEFYDAKMVPYLQITHTDHSSPSEPVKYCPKREFGYGRMHFWKSLPLIENNVAELAIHK